ncbi:hypothetical protein [Spiroplasma endosymbiont of Virgichneumon dumeticola]|uniref:hypothetical protein n=1 Tax=Spiroplasma endosymbiont of Virgichneumon dumeticola TaxID=3139323 RepID=UPI0035C89AAF
MKSSIEKRNYILQRNQVSLLRKKKRKKYQTIVKEKTPLLKINTRKDENALKIDLKQRVNEQVVKIEKQLQQLEQEKENLMKEKKKWWKNIWTTVISLRFENENFLFLELFSTKSLSFCIWFLFSSFSIFLFKSQKTLFNSN